MIQLINQYLEDHKLSWAPTTLKSERARLYILAGALGGTPQQLWDILVKVQKPYSRVTTWIRVCNFIDWGIKNGKLSGPNTFANFRDKNKRLFKNCYQRRLPNLTYAEAKERIGKLSNPDVKALAQALLQSGLRASEASKVSNSVVVGKGSKSRTAYLPSDFSGTKVSYSQLYKALRREAGLKPHDLRKLFLTRLVELGIDPFQLCEVAGWANINTAINYIQTDKNKIKELVEKVQNG